MLPQTGGRRQPGFAICRGTPFVVDSCGMKTPSALLATIPFFLAAAAAASDGIPEWYDRPASERFARAAEPVYAPELGEGTLPVVLALWPGVQFGYVQDDVSLLRFGLFGSRNHNVSILDFNLFYGRANGAETALQFGAVNVVDGPFRGAQVGLLNVSGVLDGSESTGLQFGLLGSYSDSLAGAQAALLFNRAPTCTGVQLAAVANFSDRLHGIQLAAVNFWGDEIRGAQLGAVNVGAKDFAGIQLGLINSNEGRFAGAQVALLNITPSLDRGLQLGVANFGGEAVGLQIGVFNHAQTLRGAQIGLLNHVEESDVPFLPLVRVAF